MIKAGKTLTVAISILCFGAVLLGSGVIWTLKDRVYQIRTAEQSDPLWIASRLQFELLNFNANLAEYAIGSRSAKEVVLRFDILWSRLDIMQKGKMAEVIREADVDSTALVEFNQVLEKLDPIIQSLSESEPLGMSRQAAAQIVLAEIVPYNLAFKELSLSMAQARSRLMADFRNGLLSLSRAIAYLGAVILVLASIVVIMLVSDVRLSKRKSLELQQLVAKVEASARMKANFMSVVSHELRTPLTSILGGIRLFEAKYAEELGEARMKLIKIAHRNSDRLLSLVNDILDAQSLSEGKVNLKREYLNIDSVIASTIEECEAYTAEKSINISFTKSETAMLVNADKARISQVITNLLSNAAKFSPAGSTVTLCACLFGPDVRVEVTDHGIGVSKSNQENLFSRFYQINPGTTASNKSSGLGLNIAKSLIELHGGSIGVNSIEGEGSTFWFALPLLENAEG
jgi:signal transduction histidine kinase